MQQGKILIVGQGICGTVISSLCFQLNIPFHVIDHPPSGSASIPAAGIINPVVFKRMLPGWMIESLVPEAFEYYQNMEAVLKKNFFHPCGIVKVIANENENLLWINATSNPSLSGIIAQEPLPLPELSGLLQPHHSLRLIQKAGWVDAPLFLATWKKFLQQNHLLTEELFDYRQIKNIGQSKLSYHKDDYDRIIFCEGNGVVKNPWFSNLPWVPTKGDLLVIQPEKKLPEQHIINRNGFLLPLGNDNRWLAGSTYHWNDLSPLPSTNGEEEVVEKIKKIIDVNFKVLEHWCGIRPGVTDRRPILGKHPLHPQLQIFNGMGTKGFLLAPGLAKKYLMNMDLPSECRPDRFAPKQNRQANVNQKSK
jgi:glycine/D-amino acid oxidase-like deaminating enzyme